MIFTFTKMVSIHVSGCSFPYRTASIRHVIDAGAENIPQRFGTTLTQWSHKVERFNTDIWNEMTWQQYVFNAKYPFWFPWYWILKCLKTFIPIKNTYYCTYSGANITVLLSCDPQCEEYTHRVSSSLLWVITRRLITLRGGQVYQAKVLRIFW